MLDLHAVHNCRHFPHQHEGWNLTYLTSTGEGGATARYKKKGVVIALRSNLKPFGVTKITHQQQRH